MFYIIDKLRSLTSTESIQLVISILIIFFMLDLPDIFDKLMEYINKK